MGIKRIYAIFETSEHKGIDDHRLELKLKHNLKKLTWHDYMLHVSGVEILKKQ